MVRTQIQLTECQAREVKRVARQEGISMAEMIRRCVEEGLVRRDTSRVALYERASKLIGSCEDPDGASDLSSDHDRYLDEALG